MSPTNRKSALPAQQFASDNNAGVCPEAWRALEAANAAGHAPGYGDDRWTAQAIERIRAVFDTSCDVFFVFNGTAANALALAAICRGHHAVVCTPQSHIETDECGAPQFFGGGLKLLVTDSTSPSGRLGKLTPADIDAAVALRQDVHGHKVRAVSLTQATELGTVYSAEEIAAVTRTARAHGLVVHMDGARFANAVASLAVHPAELTWRAGIDVLCLGGTKNGLPAGEAVVFFNRDLASEFAYRVKQAGQLASKMRLLTAPWVGLLEGDAWVRNARHANAMARRLHQHIEGVRGVAVIHPPQANAVFARLPRRAIDTLHDRGWRFYEFAPGGVCRLMCAWDTTPAAVDQFAEAIAAAVAGAEALEG